MDTINTWTSWIRLATVGMATAALLAGTVAAGDDEEEIHVITKTIVIGDDSPMAAFGDDHTIEVRIENGQVTVILDGKEIPADSIIRGDDGSIVILDSDGNEIQVFGRHLGDGEHSRRFRLRRGQRGDDAIGRSGPGFDVDEAHPKVMIGIHMAQPSKALQRHLGLEPGTTTMISGVLEGLPAHEAGLKQFDIITAINGNMPADPKSVREALADMEPGDTVTLAIIHEGRNTELTITLDAFDADAMKAAKPLGGDLGIVLERDFRIPLGDIDWREFVFDPDADRLFRRFERPMGKRFDELREMLRERTPGTLEDRLERLNHRIDDLKGLLDKLVDEAKALRKRSEREEE